MLGTFVNALAVLVGSALGVLLRRRIPKGMDEILMQGLGLAVIVIGVQMARGTHNVVVLILSMAIGGVLGHLLGIEAGLERLGTWAEARLGAREEGSTFARAFVTSSLLFCVGPLTILGAFQGGLGQPPVLLYTKSVLDGVSSVAIGATLGPGVFLSAGTILVYQGALTLLASSAQTLMTPDVTREFTATGGLLVLGVGITLLGLRPIRVGNLLPALLVVVVLTSLLPMLTSVARSLSILP
ncbi:MAG TPA: DUF554 domain-containing protein [bacterium]|jgi:uncharacterized membrane protein YqgA involved in biofilm formation|nr:DUF554 domain-containing protein [bacterium]